VSGINNAGAGTLIFLVAKACSQPGFVLQINRMSLLNKDFNTCRRNAYAIFKGSALFWDSDIHRASIINNG